MLQIRTSSVAAGQAAAARRLPLRTVLLALGAAVAVALSLPVADAAAARPTKAERLEARSMCALERGVTKSERRMFRSAYGGRSINRAFRRCVKRQAGRLAAKRVRRRNNALAPPGLLPGPAPVAPVAPGVPAFPEMPGVRAQCQMEQMEDPLGFAQEYPGPDPVGLCTQMESMP